MRTKIYIAGSVSKDVAQFGYLHCWGKFQKVEHLLQSTARKGAKIINPMKLCKGDWSWLRCMIVCLYHIIRHCAALYFLEDWRESRGARIEHFIAKLFKREIHYIKP